MIIPRNHLIFFITDKVQNLEKCYFLAHSSQDANITQDPNLGPCLGRRGYPFLLTLPTLPPTSNTEKLHAVDQGLNPGSSNPALKSPGKSNVLEMENDTDLEKGKTGQHSKLGTLCGQMAKKTKSDSYLTPYIKRKLYRLIKDLCIKNKTIKFLVKI